MQHIFKCFNQVSGSFKFLIFSLFLWFILNKIFGIHIRLIFFFFIGFVPELSTFIEYFSMIIIFLYLFQSIILDVYLVSIYIICFL